VTGTSGDRRGGFFLYQRGKNQLMQAVGGSISCQVQQSAAISHVRAGIAEKEQH